MQQGIDLAREVDADAVFACDPDADRLGVCSRTTDGTYRFLTGNEIAVLTTHYKLEQLKNLGRLPRRPLVIKTEVTTDLLRPITEAFDGVLVGDLLVGFKYHANVLDQLEQHGHFGALQGTLQGTNCDQRNSGDRAWWQRRDAGSTATAPARTVRATSAAARRKDQVEE